MRIPVSRVHSVSDLLSYKFHMSKGLGQSPIVSFSVGIEAGK